MHNINLGYACLNLDLDATFKTCRLNRLTPETQYELIAHNLESLEKFLLYNEKNHIHLFRISSDLIPFASSRHNQIAWQKEFKETFQALGKIIQRSQQRVSMHPGQYTVLNSPREEVVENAISDLVYHEEILSLLGCNETAKIILHVGGAYGDKPAALTRFKQNYMKLNERIKHRLILENDERIYHIEEVLSLCYDLSCPAVFDNLHHQINPPKTLREETAWISLAKETWQAKDGRQKMHYSQQNPQKKPGAHSETIYATPFYAFCQSLNGAPIDIMLEVKDKNRSAIKCLNLLYPEKKHLEVAWAKYKYVVLSKSQAHYLHLRQLLKDPAPSPLSFYETIEEALALREQVENEKNALLHVWGYFKKEASEKEKKHFFHLLSMYEEKSVPLSKIKQYLVKLNGQYPKSYLSESYYLS